MGFEKSVDCKGVVDNGQKKPQSILSKVKRQVYSGELDFSLGKLNDLSRCALIVESYSVIPRILQQLNKYYPELVGHVSRHSTGYIGIHLNFFENNIPIEVQISTPDAWLVKQASEHVYKKHRDFEAEIPYRLKMILSEENEDLKRKMVEDFKRKFKEYKEDYKAINDLFCELHKDSDLYQNMQTIEAMFLSYEVKSDRFIRRHFDYDRILEQRLTDENGVVDALLVLNNSENIQPITKDIQKKLVENVGIVFDRCNQSNEPFKMDDLQIFIYDLRSTLSNSIISCFDRYNENELLSRYKNYCSKFINKAVIQASLFAQEKYERFDIVEVDDFLSKYKKEMETEGIITDPQMLYDNLKILIGKLNDRDNTIEKI